MAVRPQWLRSRASRKMSPDAPVGALNPNTKGQTTCKTQQHGVQTLVFGFFFFGELFVLKGVLK